MFVGLVPMVASFAGPGFGPAATTLAQDGCASNETADSYSLNCVPNMVPDFSDQLTEAEVAEPGFNANHGGGGGGGGHR